MVPSGGNGGVRFIVIRVGDLVRVVCGGCEWCVGRSTSLLKRCGDRGSVYLWNESCMEQNLDDEHWVVETVKCGGVVVVLDDESGMDVKVVGGLGVVGWLPREECGGV